MWCRLMGGVVTLCGWLGRSLYVWLGGRPICTLAALASRLMINESDDGLVWKDVMVEFNVVKLELDYCRTVMW